jgi:hypothetical protein
MSTTQWTIVDDDREGVVTHISDAGRETLANEQRLDAVAKTHQITAAVGGGLFVGAILIEVLRLTFGG